MAHAGLIHALLACWLTAASGLAGTHPDSVSSSRITVSGADLELRVRTELRTWHEAALVDLDLSGALETGEIEAARESLGAYVRSHLELRPGRGDQRLGRLPLEAVSLEEVQRPRGSYPVYELVLAATLPPACDGLLLRSSLFEAENPLHRDQCTILWEDQRPLTRLVWAEDPSFLFRADGLNGGSLLLGYLRSGIEHILFGWDHLAFVLVLVMASRSVRQLGAVSLAFTLAHSLTLAASVLGWIELPSRPVEILIALSILFVALLNLRPGARQLWPEALGFGLVHGLGFAGAIAATLAAEPERVQALIGFNLGVECGQLAALAVCLATLRIASRGQSWQPASRVRTWVSLLVALAAVYWTVSRFSGG